MTRLPAQPVLPPHTTLSEFYDNPPTGNIKTGNHGSSGATAAAVAPINPPDTRQLPRHIIEDRQMCQTITGNARTYLNNSTTSPGLLSLIHPGTQMFLNAMGDGTCNIDMFANISAYVRQFVEIADGLGAGDVQVGSCDSGGRSGTNRLITRQGVEKIVAEMTTITAFNTHANEIQNLAGANDGRGTEITFPDFGIGGNSIIYNLSKHMINCNCSWGILFGGNEFMVFYLDRLVDGNDKYYYLVLSGRHVTFPQLATPDTPGLIQILIALLLGNPSIIQYNPPRVTIGDRYLMGNESATVSKKTDKGTGKKAARKSIGRRRPRTGLESPLETLLEGIQLCTLAYPNSGLPARELAFTQVNAQKAREILSGTVEGLPETDPYAQGAHPISFGAETTGQLLAFSQLGAGVCGEVYDSHFIVDGRTAQCAAKVVQYEFALFYIEVSAYDQLRGRPFVPRFYGAFVGMWVTGPLGVILMERMEKTFDSYEEMDMEEKRGALECLEQLHLAGFQHGDVSPHNFGARNGEMVILDFSQAEHCEKCGPCGTDDTCYEIGKLKETLFGNSEVRILFTQVGQVPLEEIV